MAGIETDDDLSVFFDTDEFATEVTYTLQGGGDTTLTGIFDADAVSIELGGAVPLSDTGPQVQLIEAQLPAVAQAGDTLTIDGKDWIRRTSEKDGTGLITLHLEAAS